MRRLRCLRIGCDYYVRPEPDQLRCEPDDPYHVVCQSPLVGRELEVTITYPDARPPDRTAPAR